MTQGICYFLCGGGRRQKWRRYLAPLVTSIHSLRQHYGGPVCVLLGEDVERHSLPCGVLSYFNYTKTVPLATGCRHAGYVTKASLWRHSPFDQAVLLDADTLVTGDISELFGDTFTVTSFSHWNTAGKIVGGRLQQWAERGIHAETVARLRLEPQPALNTGVTSWDRENSGRALVAWESLSLEGHECSFTDELSAQILLAENPEWFRVLSDEFNCSPTYGTHKETARILHFHGRRMAPGRGKPGAAAMYRPHLVAAIEDNAGGIADWLRDVDPALWELAQ